LLSEPIQVPANPDPLDDLEIVDLRTHPDEALLQQLYQQVYLENFTIVSEQESPDLWRPRLWTESPESLRFELHILVAGRHLSQPTRQLYGAHYCELYLASGCGLVTYLVVDHAARRTGLGRRLLSAGCTLLQERARAWNRPLRAIFAETNNPTSQLEDVMDPRQRLATFDRLGARIVDFPYVQPELAPGQGACHDLLLLALPIYQPLADSLPASTVIGFLDDFYRANEVDHPPDHPDFQQMLSAIQHATTGGPNLPLTPIPTWLSTHPS
jgi:GNAT superfamily N-acetyltransferase